MIPRLYRMETAEFGECTAAGVGIPRRRPRNTKLRGQLLEGAFLSAFDAVGDFEPNYAVVDPAEPLEVG